MSKEEDLSDLDVTLQDGLEHEDPIEVPFTEEELSKLATFTKKDVKTIVEANDNPKEPNDALKDAAVEHGAFGEVKQKPGFIPFEMRGINSGSRGLTEQTIENRKIKSKQVKKDTDVGGKGPLYNFRMGKQRKADSDKTT
tara:strand:- start:2845 stop:3264 length:420 start_codon:yes stop_codon:yes gene_type:complete